MKATDQIGRINLRQRRAMSLVSEVMRVIDPYLGEEVRARDVYALLLDLFAPAGVEVLTDSDRHQMGLPPRGPDGWTADEIIAMERRRLEILSRPILFEFPPSPAPKDER